MSFAIFWTIKMPKVVKKVLNVWFLTSENMFFGIFRQKVGVRFLEKLKIMSIFAANYCIGNVFVVTTHII